MKYAAPSSTGASDEAFADLADEQALIRPRGPIAHITCMPALRREHTLCLRSPLCLPKTFFDTSLAVGPEPHQAHLHISIPPFLDALLVGPRDASGPGAVN
ncbi:hypothetical protein MSAN_01642300 [Mycena sanguinolenta]|uniref:Uncharacterized protein n=1 Tax=Mycena sanguinolenta TaxID=230812 RepID=A0A8H6Y167_9AGAR|nr:hypothetical protein MSAN_01642300 [Mycena sanguinolenta]